MINRLFVIEEEDGQDGDDQDQKQSNHHNLMTHKNQLLDKVKKELLHRGQYQEVDQKCQSFKSFQNLMDTNQLFRELRSDPKKVSGDLNRDMNKFNAKGTVQMNQSYQMSSFHYGPD